MTEKTFQQIKDSIEEATLAASRAANSVSLLAVSKKKSTSDIMRLYQQGQQEFGENYVKESLEKIHYFQEQQICQDVIWHFIGPIQSNKTRDIAENFSWAHSVDRLKIAQRLNDQRPSNLPPIQMCIQINIDHESRKSGVPPKEAKDLALAIEQLPKLSLRGLMVIPEKTTAKSETEDTQQTNDSFKRTFELFNNLKEHLSIVNQSSFDTLSMGMSNDYPQAIQHGATIVRLGTLLFGTRD